MAVELFQITEEEQSAQKEAYLQEEASPWVDEDHLEQIKNNFRAYDQSQFFWTPLNLYKLLEPEHPAKIV